MLSRRFEELLPQLSSAYVSYADIPRTPERVRDLARARAELDLLRREVAEERFFVEHWTDLVSRLDESAV